MFIVPKYRPENNLG